MKATTAVCRKELATLWLSPLPYVVGALFHLVIGVLYVEQLEIRGQALFQPIFPIAGFLLIALVPILSMRTFAEEARTGSLDLLLAIPARARHLVVGKWLATAVSALVVVASLGVALALVSLWGSPDPGPAISGLIGLVLFSFALAAVGIAASSITSSQPVAALVAFFVGLILWFSHVGSESWAGGGVLAHFSLSERLRAFAGGVLDSTDAGLLVVLCLAGLLAAGIPLSRRAAARGGPGARSRIRAAGPVALAAAALLLLLFADRALATVRHQWDLTAERSLTLSAETRGIVDRVDGRLDITAFIDRTSPLRAQTAALLERYRDLNRKISFRLVDPGRAPAQAAQLGIDPALGGLHFRMGDRSQTASLASEQDVTAAIARVLRPESAGVCFAQGHGESDPAGSLGPDMGGAAGSLVANGYRVRSLNLFAQPEIPTDCDGLVLANPVIPLRPEAVAAVSAYLSAGGRALVLADPLSTADLRPLLAPYGLGVDRGLVVEGDDAARLGEDLLTLVVREFRSVNPAVRQLPPVLFSGSVGVTAADDVAAGISAEVLASSSAASFLDRQPAAGEPGADGFSPRFDQGVDISGPVPLVAATDASERIDGKVRRTRIILAGDFDWATNAFLGEGGNSRLFVQAVDWLTLDEDLVSVTTNLAAYRPLELSPARLTLARGILAGAVPVFFLLSGAAVWLARRRA
ncbi:MAG TPA: Gldg family protein [Acidimicrobiales bacterium]|nr:Gldg family protein [Acidimicrobiales bacterium]